MLSVLMLLMMCAYDIDVFLRLMSVRWNELDIDRPCGILGKETLLEDTHISF